MATVSPSVIPLLTGTTLSIYGVPSIYGFRLPPNSPLTFGVIYQLGIGYSGAYSVGQNVLIPYVNTNAIIYGNQTYWLIEESKIILVESKSIS
jgi:hypothetical protein